MAPDPASLLALISGAALSLVVSVHIAAQRTAQQQQIVRSGTAAEGRIVRIWQPPLQGSFPRIYFEYTPHGASRPIVCCHIDRRSADEFRASLPAVGASVRVRYLPQRPYQAVIAKLVDAFPVG
jgi:hypothetical protein